MISHIMLKLLFRNNPCICFHFCISGRYSKMKLSCLMLLGNFSILLLCSIVRLFQSLAGLFVDLITIVHFSIDSPNLSSTPNALTSPIPPTTSNIPTVYHIFLFNSTTQADRLLMDFSSSYQFNNTL